MYKKIIYIVLLIIILVFGFVIYNSAGKNNADDSKSKTFSEVKQIESKLVDLFNLLNNIQYDNYKISTSQIKKDESSDSQDSSEQKSGQSSSSGKSSNSKSEGESSGGQSSSGDSSSSEQNNKDNVKYSLQENSILVQEDEIDWKTIKVNVETLYSITPNITLDLYQLSVNQKDIVDFNSKLDNLTQVIKDEDKQKTLVCLADLYDYIPKFIEKCSDDETENIAIKTKNNILKAYSILETDDWNSISNYINDAVQEFTSLLTGIGQDEGKQFNVNKVYIMINELQTCIKLQDKEIFLIKYKNLLEELRNI